jgi:hypothetical protein
MDLLRPKPFRGDVVAAGVVVLATLVASVQVRFAGAWDDGVHLGYAALATALVGTLAVLAPMERPAPRAYQSVLYVATLALVAITLLALGGVLGAEPTGDVDNGAWMLAVEAAAAFAFATRRNSAVCTLLGAVSAGGAVLLLVDLLFSPASPAPYRWVLAGLVVVYGLAAVGQRDRRLHHGVALIDAAGLAVLAIAATFVIAFVTANDELDFPHVGWGWELLIVAAGFGLIAYSSVDRQPGPAYFGVLNLAAFTIITSFGVERPTLLGWPLALAAATIALLVIGLRPTTPAPPPPDIDAPEPPPLPLR